MGITLQNLRRPENFFPSEIARHNVRPRISLTNPNSFLWRISLYYELPTVLYANELQSRCTW